MGVEDGGYKPTELEQVMETKANSEDLGRLKNPDFDKDGPISEFTRGTAEWEKKIRKARPMDATDDFTPMRIRTGEETESKNSPEVADRLVDSDIANELASNTAKKAKIFKRHVYSNSIEEAKYKIANVNETKKALAERKAKEAEENNEI